MKISLYLLVFLAVSCAHNSDAQVQKIEAVRVIYTDFDIVSSTGVFDLNTLRGMYPQVKDFDADKSRSLLGLIEGARIGKSTRKERSQMTGPVFLAIFRSSDLDHPVFVSDGCYLLNIETHDIYTFEYAAASYIGVEKKVFESRLCAQPGLGIKLSPRPRV